jgi:hypothetical protein
MQTIFAVVDHVRNEALPALLETAITRYTRISIFESGSQTAAHALHEALAGLVTWRIGFALELHMHALAGLSATKARARDAIASTAELLAGLYLAEGQLIPLCRCVQSLLTGT